MKTIGTSVKKYLLRLLDKRINELNYQIMLAKRRITDGCPIESNTRIVDESLDEIVICEQYRMIVKDMNYKQFQA